MPERQPEGQIAGIAHLRHKHVLQDHFLKKGTLHGRNGIDDLGNLHALGG